jgi:DNA-binding PadR family transcriptional regulator
VLTANLITFYDITYNVMKESDPTILVLASLAAGDKHGYAMMMDIESFAGIRLGPGTLYGAITRLEERGWIRPIGAAGRRQAYRLTNAGREYLKERIASLDQVVRTALGRLKEA